MISSKSELPVSGCMIAQDEEKYIEAAILNVLPNVSELVVVDGGSTDKTIEIATKMGCRVITRPFQFDFSAQKNFALEQCKKDWVVWVDADESFSEGFWEVLPALIVNALDNCGAYQVRRVSVFDGSQVGDDFQWRVIHRNRCRWSGKIHEGLEFLHGSTGFKLPMDITMLHRHSMNRQRYNNALYYNVNNGIAHRPQPTCGMEYVDGRWVVVPTDRNS